MSNKNMVFRAESDSRFLSIAIDGGSMKVVKGSLKGKVASKITQEFSTRGKVSAEQLAAKAAFTALERVAKRGWKIVKGDLEVIRPVKGFSATFEIRAKQLENVKAREASVIEKIEALTAKLNEYKAREASLAEWIAEHSAK